MTAPSLATASHEGYAELPSGRLWFLDTGVGVPIVFLHALSGTSMVWEKQLPDFVNAGYRLIAYDRRGYGRSTWDGDTRSLVPSDQELTELVDSLRIDSFYLVGVAAGGGIALHYALNNSERVLGLVIANSLANVSDGSYVALGKRMRPSPCFDAMPIEFRELGPSFRAQDPDGVQRWLELSGQIDAVAKSQRPRSLAPSDLGDVVTLTRLESLKAPTLLLTGDADLYMPPSVLRMLARHIKHSEIVIVPESGHASHWENPEIFNLSVLAFLRRHQKP